MAHREALEIPQDGDEGTVNDHCSIESGIAPQSDAKNDTIGAGGWKACPFILANECCERLAYYGISTNLVVYMTKKLNQTNATAATNVTNWSGTCYIMPLIGAFLADAYLGRYWTIALFSMIYFMGMSLLTVTSAVESLKPKCDKDTCASATLTQLSVFYFALYLIALGTGGIKPCVSSFGADQFDDNNPRERNQKTSFFNWFYFSINIGALVSSTILVYIQDQVSWTWGFGIPTVAMAVAVCSFFSATKFYRHQPPGGSPLTRVAQVLVAAFRKWNVKPYDKEVQLYELEEGGIRGSRKLQHTQNFRFLDKAAVITKERETGWSLCTVTQIEEVKLILRLLPIWASSIVFSTVYSQMSTLFVEQGGLMNIWIGKFRIPPASLSTFDTLSVILLVPMYDRLLVPFVRKFTGRPQGFTLLQRMGIGLCISIFAMVAAALVEVQRLHRVKHMDMVNANFDDKLISRQQMSIFWQVPQYFLIGAAEVFTFIGQIEFFYDQAPDAMRSVGSALSLTTNALGNYLSSLLVTVVMHSTKHGNNPGWIADNLNTGHMDYFFWLLAILSILNLGFYLVCAKWYKYKVVN